VFLTSGTSWAVPGDWNSGNNTVEVIGGGGRGSTGVGCGTGPKGGGGGGYSRKTNVTLTPGASISYAVGSGGAAGSVNGGDSYLCSSSSNCASISGTAVVVGAKGGLGGANGGTGGSAGGGVGATRHSGGAGGLTYDCGGAGGGGAAGPNGNGGAGGRSDWDGGGGGGGNGGGTAGNDNNAINGGNGGNNSLGSGGGAGGVAGAGTAGTNGGGGGGGQIGFVGGNGGNGVEWTTHGSGGGGGGSGTSLAGRVGGLYGGGGSVGADAAAGGNGAQGLIVITYTRSGCTGPAKPAGTIIYNGDDRVLQWCDGAQWQPAGPIDPDGPNDGCAAPDKPGGFLFFNGDHCRLQYCDGDTWRAIGKDAACACFTCACDPSLVAHWRLDENSGTVANDSRGTNHGSLVNSPIWSTGQGGSALTFNGSNNYVSVPYASSMNLTGDLTVAAWVRPAAFGGGTVHRIVNMPHNEADGAEQYALVTTETGEPRFYIGGTSGDSWVGAISLPLNTWSHVAGTINGTTMTLYVNGAAAATGTFTGTRSGHLSGDASIGRFSSSFPQLWNGRIDDVRVYGRALSAGEIATISGPCD